MTEFTYRLTFVAPVSVFAGHSIAGLLDRGVVRCSDGAPYIPGSTVKGRLRYFAERLATTLDDVHALWHEADKPHCKQRETACAVCRLFGNPALPAALAVSDARLQNSDEQTELARRRQNGNSVLRGDSIIQPGIALSRSRRTALTDHLFFDETVEALVFSGCLSFNASPSQIDLNFLKTAAQLVDALGARKAAGRGRLLQGVEMIEAGTNQGAR